MRLNNPENQPPAATFSAQAPLVDNFHRRIDYVRVSVTDRCDFRCVYCMSENMQFL
ncbi:MAG: GTP 3',8-cyclase MoaA, partial [Rhodoblastus sp.]